MTLQDRRNIEQYLQAKHNGRYRRRIEGNKVQCEDCGSTVELVWHHVIPFSEGGTDDPQNLVVLCNACHLLIHKSNNDFREAGRWGGLVSAYLREQRLGRERFCEEMRTLAKRRRAA